MFEEEFVNYREMELKDYDAITSLWQKAEGISLRGADSREGIQKYLLRNPKLSFVAEYNDKLVGTIMSGHDGKRGYIQHLAVDPMARNCGIATTLLKMCLSALESEGIIKSHIHVMTTNEVAKRYWENRGWFKRNDIEVYSFINGGDNNT